MQQCFMIKVLFGCKEENLTFTLKRNNYCKDATGNARNINRQVLTCRWASEELEGPSGHKSHLRPEVSVFTAYCSISILHVAASPTMP